MKIIASLLALALLTATAFYAQNQPILGEDTVKVSDHVWAIMGFPNVGIVVGGNATLVVDTGAGGRAMAPRSPEWRKSLRPITSSISPPRIFIRNTRRVSQAFRPGLY